jgi:hypothetical protein
LAAEIINLRKARKAKGRRQAEAQAAENRTRFGQPKAEREARDTQSRLADRRLEGHRIEGAEAQPEKPHHPAQEASGEPDRPA